MGIIQLSALVGFCFHIQTVLASNCLQEMNYGKFYGYKYDIDCHNLNESNIKELQSITVQTKVKLAISKSNLTSITSKFFKNLPNTRELIINTSVIPLDGIFSTLSELDLLILNNNSIDKVPPNFLEGVKKIRALNVSHNRLSYFPNGTFADTDLLELDVSFNQFDDFAIPCELQQLTLLDLKHNQLKTLQNFSVQCLPQLQDLRLDSNRISELKPLTTLRYLKKLDLSRNSITHIKDYLSDLENLNKLNIAENALTSVSVSNFKNLSYLSELNLAKNLIQKIDLPNLKSLSTINLEMNNLTKFPLLNITSLRKLDLSHNQISLDQNFYKLFQLTELRLSHCMIGEIIKQFHQLNSLEVLDLAYSSVILHDSSFLNLNRLRELYLSGNSIGTLPSLNLQNLEILNLSHNALTKLEDASFNKCSKLTVLDLSHNSIEHIHENVLKPLGNLIELNLGHNNLIYISYGPIATTLTNLRVLNILGNKFSCQFLTGMMYYFNMNHIEFGFKGVIGDFNENVAGIHCHEDRPSVSGSKISDTLILVIVLVILGLLTFILLLIYRIYVFIRKRTNIDEVELLDRRFRLRNFLYD